MKKNEFIKSLWILKSQKFWFFNDYSTVINSSLSLILYTDVHKRRLTGNKTKLFAKELYLHLKTITECRAKAQLPISACPITHPSCLSPGKGGSIKGEQAASSCPEYLSQKGVYIRSLSQPFSHRSMVLPCHPKELENRTVLAYAGSLDSGKYSQGGRKQGPPPHTLGPPLW